ncbi:MAG: zinc metalloprotease HtpX [Parcubacteria group bacterium]|nr:zinc metalloprotease HtpX [Parcubacteria group bacterium]
MYSQIDSNKRKTWILIFIFLLFLAGVGYAFGVYMGEPIVGLILAGIAGLIMTLVSLYKGDKVALATAGAKQISKKDNAYVYNMVENLAITAGLPMPKVYIIHDPAINAFATGRDPKHASVAVTTGAIDTLENEELEGVLAHELSHIQNYDIRIMTVVIVLVGLIALISDLLLRMHIWGGRHRDKNGSGWLILVGILLAILSPIIANIIKLAISRKREYLADASGSLLTRYPEGLAKALEKIHKQNKPMQRANNATAHLFLSSPFGSVRKGLSKLFATHPPIEDRIKVLRKM